MTEWYDSFQTGNTLYALTGMLSLFLLSWTGTLLFFSWLFRKPVNLQILADWTCLMTIVSLAWGLWIYSLCYGPSLKELPSFYAEAPPTPPLDMRILLQQTDAIEVTYREDIRGGFIGGFDFMGLAEISPVLGDKGPLFPVHLAHRQLPHVLFMGLHGMFFLVIVTPLLIWFSGEIRWEGQALFALLWGTLVFAPVTHWGWGDGWLETQGLLDSSGGLFYLAVASAALGIEFVRSRLTSGPPPTPSANVNEHYSPQLAIGLLLFWSGSVWLSGVLTYEYGGKAAISTVNCHLSACAAVFASLGMDRFFGRRDSIFSGILGGMAGLAAIASGSSVVLPKTAVIIGIIAGVVFQLMAEVLPRSQPDREPAMQFINTWGIPSLVGVLLAGVFATSSIAEHDMFGRPIEGVIGGNSHQIVAQLLGAAATIAYSALVSGFVYWLVAFFGKPLWIQNPTPTT